jgi:hypothetical protein
VGLRTVEDDAPTPFAALAYLRSRCQFSADGSEASGMDTAAPRRIVVIIPASARGPQTATATIPPRAARLQHHVTIEEPASFRLAISFA